MVMCHSIALVFLLRSAAIAHADSSEIGVVHPEVDSKMSNKTVTGIEGLFHLLNHDTQHHLALALERHGAQPALEDPEVNALMTGLLHDELEEREEDVHKKWLADREIEAKKRQEAEERHKQKLEAQEAEREASRLAHQQEMDKMKEEMKAERERAKAEMEERHRAHEAFMRKNEERREEAARRHAASKEKNAANWERMQGLLATVHKGLEQATDGWRDAPFWDDFFQNASTASSWQQLGAAHLESALTAAGIQAQSHVLVLEPGKAGLAQSIAEGIRKNQFEHVLASTYSDEQSAHHDLVVEVGLLDAMAMGQIQGGDENRLEALKKASSRLASLVKPGGTWISVSAVPPTLRVPMLSRLSGRSFAVPSENEDPTAGTHTIVLSSAPQILEAKGLRGSASSQVTNMLLYGSKDAHVWAYRMRRVDAGNEDEGIPESALDGLLDVIRQQRPGTREDL
eukprot:gnl/MRDRNA2_/MRDRNA2_101211_c0_seq1.p1 gnl/MRDRNA2_/MRDRNA2_101211_c0~~gnl/MRDRNA2_/MRDRNA2_101211_c0_seq1.p1  ORF type:complete len:457 (+),score=132.93 gnl/MRDRNA2_/MRDRNA2_101211_c0_seq1:111-1481(+)